MPNEYSIKLHDFLTEKIAKLERMQSELSTESENDTDAFIKGQLEEIRLFRAYLKDHIDLKNFNYY